MATLFTQGQVSLATAASFQQESFTYNGSNVFTLSSAPAVDKDGDRILNLSLNGLEAREGVDYTLQNNQITWISTAVSLAAGDVLKAFYLPL